MARVIPAFLNGEPTRMRNLESTGTTLLLCGNRIAAHGPGGMLLVSLAGHASPLTRRTLNGLPHVSVNQRNWDQYLNDCLWDGRPAWVRPDGTWVQTTQTELIWKHL